MKIVKRMISYMNGKRLARRLLRKDSATVYILNNLHIGDVCHALAYIQPFKAIYGVDRVTVIRNEKLDEVYAAYSYAGFHTVTLADKAQTDLLLYLSKSARGRRLVKNRKFIVTHTSYYLSSGEMEAGKISVHQLLIKRAYALPEGTKATAPKIPESDISALVDQYGIVKGRTVIMNPYALSMHVPTAFFQWIADQLRGEGYRILTNVVGADQRALEGSAGITLSLSDMYRLAGYCGALIGLRSGFMDFLASAPCGIYVVYSDTYAMRHAYNMAAWGFDEALFEYVVPSSNWRAEAAKIVEAVLKRQGAAEYR